MTLDLTLEEKSALMIELNRAIDSGRDPRSAHTRRLRGILEKLEALPRDPPPIRR
jgi:hypothetical protein